MKFSGFLLLALTASGFAAPPDEDDDERAARRLQVRRAVRENCTICHADDLITAARLTPKQWKAEVEKMIGWGAPLLPEQREPVIEFLTAEYPSTEASPVPPRADFGAIARLIGQDFKPIKGNPLRGEASYAKNCANCHGPDGQGADLGPNLVEQPVLWNVDDWTRVIRKGRNRMPALATLIDPAAEDDILAWLRARRYRPKMPAPK